MAKQELAKFESQLAAIEQVAAENAELVVSGVAQTLTQAFTLAAAVEKVSELLTPDVMARLISLKNKGRLGWRTDKEYTPDQYHALWVDMILRGALPVNDEVCCIGGNGYLEKNYFRRRLKTYKGLTDLRIQPGKVEMKPSGALVEMTLICLIDGEERKVERLAGSSIPVRLNAGQGADAALGKAERKIMAQFWGQLTGSVQTMSDSDAGLEDLQDSTVRNEPTAPAPAAEKPKPKTTRAEQTAAALKAAKEATPKEENGGDQAPDNGEKPWPDEDEPKAQSTPPADPGPQGAAGTPGKRTAGFVREGGTGDFLKITVDATVKPAEPEPQKEEFKKPAPVKEEPLKKVEDIKNGVILCTLCRVTRQAIGKDETTGQPTYVYPLYYRLADGAEPIKILAKDLNVGNGGKAWLNQKVGLLVENGVVTGYADPDTGVVEEDNPQ